MSSLRRHNREGLPCYLSVPAADRSAFEDRIGTDWPEIIADEEILGGSVAQSWTSQQLVKLRFAGLGVASCYAWFDSDFVIIRDFDRYDFMAYPEVPYTLFEEVRRNVFQDRLLGAPDAARDPAYARMLSGLDRPFRLIKDTFQRQGPLYFFGAPAIWSSAAVLALRNWLETTGRDFEMMLSLSPFELNWYGEYVLAKQPIPVVPRSGLAFHFTRDEEYRRFSEAGFEIPDLAAQGYLAVNFAAKWMESVAVERRPAPPRPAAVEARVEVSRPEGIDIDAQWAGSYHRTGWGWALEALRPLHRPGGIRVEGFVEKKFGWGDQPGDRRNAFEPYRRPWIGFWHNPPGIPGSFNGELQSPQDILSSDGWLRSLPFCRGLFTLSETVARWLRERLDVPICSLKHPSPTPRTLFSLDAYLRNPSRSIVQVGFWLRRFSSMYMLPVTTLHKVVLDLQGSLPVVRSIVERDLQVVPTEKRSGVVTPLRYLDNDGYDQCLSRNLVFLHLYDASANNALVECIVRHTPVLVNPLEAVVEYLGPDYPFYFRTLEEAAAKAESEATVAAAHRYLEKLAARQELTQEAFRRSFLDSSICRRLGIGRGEDAR